MHASQRTARCGGTRWRCADGCGGAPAHPGHGDDPDRYASGKARKNCAGTSPITRASGKRKIVAARFIRNDRLTDALMAQAFATLGASHGARALYDAERARADTTTHSNKKSPAQYFKIVQNAESTLRGP
jgi:hypothetical protein